MADDNQFARQFSVTRQGMAAFEHKAFEENRKVSLTMMVENFLLNSMKHSYSKCKIFGPS